jgi:hypothetical protein
MYTTYHLSSAQEITVELLESIKAAFQSKPITITVEEEMDTTTLLLANAENKAMLDKSIQQDKNGQYISIKKSDLEL